MMQEEYKNLETGVLVDMLARHTADYTKMLHDGTTGKQYDDCKQIVTLLQAEIQFRNQAPGNTTVTDATVFNPTVADTSISDPGISNTTVSDATVSDPAVPPPTINFTEGSSN